MQIKLASIIRNAACGEAGRRARSPEEAGCGATEGPLASNDGRAGAVDAGRWRKSWGEVVTTGKR
jgi:hypothetical protein